MCSHSKGIATDETKANRATNHEIQHAKKTRKKKKKQQNIARTATILIYYTPAMNKTVWQNENATHK